MPRRRKTGVLCTSISSENNQELAAGGDDSMAGGSMGLSQRAFRDSEIKFERPGLFIHQPWQALAAQVNISSCLPACLFTFSHRCMPETVDLQSLRWFPTCHRALEGRTVIMLRCGDDQLLHSSTFPLNNRTVTRCHSNDCLARDIGTFHPAHFSASLL